MPNTKKSQLATNSVGGDLKSSSKPKTKNTTIAFSPSGHLTTSQNTMPNKASLEVKPDAFEFDIANGSNKIPCAVRPSKPQSNSSVMVFTHGAGGTISTPAVANFADGFVAAASSQLKEQTDTNDSATTSIICFQGTMNLKSRTSMFHTVISHYESSQLFDHRSDSVSVLGGRSMGARAAVIAASETKSIKTVVLFSYPLLGQNGDVRDQILLDIEEDIEVLFISGDKDNMCDVDKLNAVRKKMKARSWFVVIEGADHGTNCRQKSRTKEMQMETGRIVAEWVNHGELRSTAGNVSNMEGCKMIMSLPLNARQAVKPETTSPPRRDPGGKRKRGATGGNDKTAPESKDKKVKRK